MNFNTKSLLSTWRQKTSWASVPTADVESHVEKKRFLDDVSGDGSSRSTSEDGEINWTPVSNSWKTQRRSWLLLILNVLVLAGSLWANRSVLWDVNHCIRETSYFSPVYDKLQVKMHEVLFNGTIWPASEEGWSRLEKGDPDAEAQWESFESVEHFPITRAQVIALGKDPHTAAKFDNDIFGFGDDAYIASLDSSHKMHCLNELRKAAFENYGRHKMVSKQHSQLWWLHKRHCLDLIAQDLMCHADAEVFVFNWMDTQIKPFPDFSINRKCRSMEDLETFRMGNTVPLDKYLQMKKPKDAHQVPNELGYYAMFGFDGSDLYPNGVGAPPLPDLGKWYGNITRNRERNKNMLQGAHSGH